jgi:hypothetical protein
VCLRFEVLTVMKIHTGFFQVMISCYSVAGGYQYFWWPYCFHLQGNPEDGWQYVPPKLWYSPIKLQPGVITQGTTIQKVYVTYHFEFPPVIAFQWTQNWANSVQFRTSQIFLSYILKFSFTSPMFSNNHT